MSHYISKCSTVMYEQKYLEFLLEHYQELHLPYSFPVSLSFISSPVLMESEKGEAFLCFNEEYEVVGAFGYIYGTGEHQYKDRHIVQIQIVFLLEEYRRTRLFLTGLQFLTQYLAQLDKEVQELRFWTLADDYLCGLFAKIAERTTSVETVFGQLDEYRASFPVWQAYVSKFQRIFSD